MIKDKRWLCTITATTALGFAIGASAAMYKWVDENGQVHYTQSPPPNGIRGETIAPPPKVNSESALKFLKEKEEGFDKRLDEKAKLEQKAAEDAAQAGEVQKYCEQLRSSLQGLETAQRIYTEDGGNRRRMPEEERQARIAEIKEKLAKDCQ